MSYNEILKELREMKKLTQTQLAKKFNLTQRQVSTYEIGRNEPAYDILKKYAEYFEVSTDYILGLTRDSTPYWDKKINKKEQSKETTPLININANSINSINNIETNNGDINNK